MRRTTIIYLSLCAASLAVATGAPASKRSKTEITLEGFVRATLSKGFPARLPGLLAEQIGIAREAPYYGLAISSAQVTDQTYHSFRVISASPDEPKPVGLLFETSRDWPGNNERYLYRTSSDGQLERAVVIHAKRDAHGQSIKGSGVTTEVDIATSDSANRFRHELDLWLKRTYLKKEWRAAEFADGALEKKNAEK